MTTKSADILLVEDNALNRQLVCVILQQRGHRVREAYDVLEARQALTTQTPDLVLLDVQIPGGGGLVILKEIRQDDVLKSLPVVAVTAFAMAGDQEQLLDAGFDGYISKPINVRTFAAQVEAFLHQRNDAERG